MDSLWELVSARRGEDRPFAYFSDESPLSVDDLRARSESLAFELAEMGFGPSSRILVMATAGSQQLSALLACWKIGALVCPADAFLSERAFSTLVAHFRPALLLLDRTMAARKDFLRVSEKIGIPWRVLGLSAEESSGTAAQGSISFVPAREHPALCLFTSGSSGDPKGVLLTGANLLAGVRNLVEAKSLTARDRGFCLLPLFHVNGLVTTFLSPLASGGSVVYWQRPFHPRDVLSLIDRMECTWVSGTPLHYRRWMSPPLETGAWSLRHLRFFRTAAAPMPVKLLEDFEAHYGVPLIETMGMTEASGQIFSNPLPPAERKAGSVGLPVGTKVRVVAEDGRECGEGDPGEIELQGEGVMAGYLDDPERTAKACHDGWLKTGDIGYRDSEGYFFIAGRKKDVAIYSGLKISLRALEIELEQIGEVAVAACVGQPHPEFGEVIAREGVTDFPKLAEDAASAVFPLLPSSQAFEFMRIVAAIPRSAAGKILKGKLPEEAVLFEWRESE